MLVLICVDQILTCLASLSCYNLMSMKKHVITWDGHVVSSQYFHISWIVNSWNWLETIVCC
jgi:hypothetical protein